MEPPKKTVHPTVAAAICRQPARRAGIVVRLYLYQSNQKRLSFRAECNGVEESSRVASFILWLFLIPRGGFLHSADATVGMTCRGGWYRSTKRVIFVTIPAPRRGWMAMNHRRYIVPCIGLYHSPTQVVIGTWRAAGSRPYIPYEGWYRSTPQVVIAAPTWGHDGA